MTQLSAQFEAQLDLFRTFTTRALDSAGQLAALNVRTSRATVEQAAGAVKQLLEVRDPRDLFALGSAAQGQWHALFSYGRELFGLAAGVRPLPARLSMPMPLLAAPAPTANVPTSYSQIVEQASIATADAATISSEIAAAAVDIGAAHAQAAIDASTRSALQPEAAAAPAREDAQRAEFEAAIETAIADEVPPAEPTALAKALHEVAPKSAAVEHPLASTVPLEAAENGIELPPLTPPKASRSSRRK